MTFKKALLRGLIGFPLGIFIGYTITIITSAIFAQGYYSAVVPLLVIDFGSEIMAVTVQYFLCGLLGFASAASSAIFQIDNWSITRQTVVHFVILAGSMLSIGYVLHWIPGNVIGALIFIGIFILIYVVIWLVQMRIWKKKIAAINHKLEQ